MVRRQHDAMPSGHRGPQALDPAKIHLHYAMAAQQTRLKRPKQRRPKIAAARRHKRVGFGDNDGLHGASIAALVDSSTF
jgi:hypothetical protein